HPPHACRPPRPAAPQIWVPDASAAVPASVAEPAGPWATRTVGAGSATVAGAGGGSASGVGVGAESSSVAATAWTRLDVARATFFAAAPFLAAAALLSVAACLPVATLLSSARR